MRPEALLALFPSRPDAHGLWPDSGKPITKRQPLLAIHARSHLEGKVRIGSHCVLPDGTSPWAVLDVDEGGATPVLDLRDKLQQYKIAHAVEKSKAKGYHFWLWFESPVPAWKARAVLKAIAEEAGWPDLEVFPKQDAVGDDGLGNFVWLPLHGESAKEGRTLFLDTDKGGWPPYEDQAAFLVAVPKVSEATLDKIISEKGLQPPAERKAAAASSNGDGAPTSGTTTLPLPPCAAKIYAEGVTSPGRSDWAHFLARHFRRRGLPEEATVGLLLPWNQKNRPEPLPPGKVEEMVRTAYVKEYTSLGCEYLKGAQAICGEACPVRAKEKARAPSAAGAPPFEDRPLPPLVVPAREFLRRPRADQAKLIPRLGGRRGGKLGDYGPGGAGKSYVFLNVAVAAALGVPLLGHPDWAVAAPLCVTLLSLEDPTSEQLERLARLLPFFGLAEPPEGLHIFDRDIEEEGFLLAGPRGFLNERAFRRLDACLGDLKTDLLLVEPKSYLVGVEENSSSENMPWQRRFQDLLIRHGTLALIGHHAGWDREGKIHARGTTVFRDWVDGMIQQTEDQIQGKPGFLLTCNKSNFAARWEPLSVLFDPETGGMKAVDEVAGKLPPALLRACFQEHGGSIGGKLDDVWGAIAEYAACSPATARRGTEAAVKEGWLRTLGRGKGYGLSAHGGENG